MGCIMKLFLLLTAATAAQVNADTLVTGTIFCDQCKDGERSIFDYPLYGAKVAVECGGGIGDLARTLTEDTTNWLGCYAMRLDGSVDLNGCSARVLQGPTSCGVTGPARGMTLMFRMLGMAMYTVEPLFSQPQEPTWFCPRDDHSALPSLPPPLGPAWPLPSPPPPSVPILEASACPYEKWLMPEYKCYWKVVSPDTTVALAFGPIAAERYGIEITLWDGLHGRGEIYYTLLREGITSLLNSFNTITFSHSTVSVIDYMNQALLDSPQQALVTALRFRRANLGNYGPTNVSCNFIACS
ncbi:uncharacterized protein [Typha angustifolia]|uniref:uncharacterized protein n=1 Tax=Typha angustifolia TaxID=59011 RepID=UPI003C2B4D02